MYQVAKGAQTPWQTEPLEDTRHRTPGGHQASVSAVACVEIHRDIAGKGCSMLELGIPASVHYLSPEPQLASQVVMPDLFRELDTEIPRGPVLRDALLHDLINDV